MITIHLPNGKTFDLSNEISLAKNIKDTINRKKTVRGLNIIQQYL